jgi:hypothetical protein
MTSADDELRLWAASGAMALTGLATGPPLVGPGRPATSVANAMERLRASAWRTTEGAQLPGVGVLGERAAYAGLARRGPLSCGGAFRVLPTLDGHLGLSLPRASDLELVPALVEGTVVDPWDAVTRWAGSVTTREAAERVQLLGLPGSGIGLPLESRPAVITRATGSRIPRAEPLVVDLSSMWAGPLCTHLLTLLGARVVKVESSLRPDGARVGSPAFFAMLHQDQTSVVIDFRTELPRLRALVGGADLVVVSARTRALEQLGLVAEDVVATGTSWLAITARGRGSTAVGFGDDVAAGAGHLVVDHGRLMPVGDALADPLAGLAAAVAAAEALASAEARLIDVSMAHVAHEAMGPAPFVQTQPPTHRRRDGTWWVETATGVVQVLDPAPRP